MRSLRMISVGCALVALLHQMQRKIERERHKANLVVVGIRDWNVVLTRIYAVICKTQCQ